MKIPDRPEPGENARTATRNRLGNLKLHIILPVVYAIILLAVFIITHV